MEAADKCSLSREAYIKSLVEMYEVKPSEASMDNPRCDVVVMRPEAGGWGVGGAQRGTCMSPLRVGVDPGDDHGLGRLACVPRGCVLRDAMDGSVRLREARRLLESLEEETVP